MRLAHVALFLMGLSGPALAGSDPHWHRSATLDYRVAPDGNSVATEIWEVRADTASIARTIAQQSYSFMADLEQVDLVAAYTRKQDGRILPVPGSSVLDKAVTTTATAPQFSGQTMRTIVFPQVGAGDTVHYELRRSSKESLFPGEFLLAVELGGASVAERVGISVTLPPGRVLRAAALGLDEQPAEPRGDGQVVRRWALALNAAGPVSLQGSTFADYAAVGRAYAARAWRPAQPGPGVRALAEALAPAGTGDREAAERLYRYVASDIRYVALFLGQGRVVPRDAETVLAEGWGDCKDHDALLRALLAAKGIAAEPALISLHSRYDLPDPPGLSALDHVVTYVASLDLYLDSTAPYAPFGLLLPGEYDKPVVISDLRRTRLGRTPKLPADGISLETRTLARVGEDGVVSGDTTTQAAGPQSIALRSMAAWFEGRGLEYAAGVQLQLVGTPGAGRFSFASPDEIGGEYAMDGHFILDERWVAGGAPFALPGGLGVFGRPGKQLLGAAPTEDGGYACLPGREVEEIRLLLPAGTHLGERPQDVEMSAGAARYTAHYTLGIGMVSVRREFRLRTDHARCDADEFAQMRPALAAARRDQQALLTLVRAEPQRIAAGGTAERSAARDPADPVLPAESAKRVAGPP